MAARMAPQKREARVVVDLRCYDREAVAQAAAIFLRQGQAEFFIEKEGPETLEVAVRTRDDAAPGRARRLAGDFLNEALNQDLRLGTARSNKALLQLLTAQALRSAAGDPGRKPVDAKAERRLRQEARRLMRHAQARARTERRGGRR